MLSDLLQTDGLYDQEPVILDPDCLPVCQCVYLFAITSVACSIPVVYTRGPRPTCGDKDIIRRRLQQLL